MYDRIIIGALDAEEYPKRTTMDEFCIVFANVEEVKVTLDKDATNGEYITRIRIAYVSGTVRNLIARGDIAEELRKAITR